MKTIQIWVPEVIRPQNMVSTYIGPKFNVKARKVWSIVLQECVKATEEQFNYICQELGMINIIDA